jgi:hypothetical protein
LIEKDSFLIIKRKLLIEKGFFLLREKRKGRERRGEVFVNEMMGSKTHIRACLGCKTKKGIRDLIFQHGKYCGI